MSNQFDAPARCPRVCASCQTLAVAQGYQLPSDTRDIPPISGQGRGQPFSVALQTGSEGGPETYLVYIGPAHFLTRPSGPSLFVNIHRVFWYL
jgi:hypothetical protein